MNDPNVERCPLQDRLRRCAGLPFEGTPIQRVVVSGLLTEAANEIERIQKQRGAVLRWLYGAVERGDVSEGKACELAGVDRLTWRERRPHTHYTDLTGETMDTNTGALSTEHPGRFKADEAVIGSGTKRKIDVAATIANLRKIDAETIAYLGGAFADMSAVRHYGDNVHDSVVQAYCVGFEEACKRFGVEITGKEAFSE